MAGYYTFLFLISFSAFSQSGLRGEYFSGRNFNKKVLTRIDPQINFNWDRVQPAPGMPMTDYSIRWTGRLLAPISGDYEFSALVDDGMRLWVGGIKVIDAWGPHDHENVSGKVALKANQMYELRIEYFNGILEGQFKLSWEIPESKNTTFLERLTGRSSIVDRKYFLLPPVPQPQVEPIPTAKPIESPNTNPESFAEKPVSKNADVRPKEKGKEEREIKKPTESQTESVANPPIVSLPKNSKMKDTIEKYTPKNILFEAGEPFIKPESYPELNLLVKLLKRFQRLRVQIDGHTDITGDPKINLQLSKDRASEVSFYLTEQGIDEGRIRTNGFGATKPLFSKDSTRKYPQNRRVEFKIY